MAGKGRPKTGGRKKGVGNLRARYLSEQAAKAGLTPKDYLLGVLRDPRASIERRDWAAATLAPYVHPRLAAIEARVDQYNQVEMRVTRAELAAEAKKRIDEAFREYSPPKTIDLIRGRRRLEIEGINLWEQRANPKRPVAEGRRGAPIFGLVT